MHTAKTIEDVVAYLKKQPIGSTCMMTGGSRVGDHLGSEFLQRGIRVSHKGAYGNRIITLTEVTDVRVEQLKEYKASKRTVNQYLIGNVKKNGIPAGVPTYVQGNHTTLTRQLRKYVGAGNYAIKKQVGDPRGEGWTITVSIPILRIIEGKVGP